MTTINLSDESMEKLARLIKDAFTVKVGGAGKPGFVTKGRIDIGTAYVSNVPKVTPEDVQAAAIPAAKIHSRGTLSTPELKLQGCDCIEGCAQLRGQVCPCGGGPHFLTNGQQVRESLIANADDLTVICLNLRELGIHKTSSSVVGCGNTREAEANSSANAESTGEDATSGAIS